MAFGNTVSTPGEIKSMGGEVKTNMPQGTLIGGFFGLLLGGMFSFLFSTRTIWIPGLERIPGVLMVIFVIGFCTVFFAAAGTLIGIGVPKFNPLPEQGKVKRWSRMVLVRQGKQEKVVYTPEVERKDTERDYHL